MSLDRMQQWLAQQYPAMLALCEDLVNIDGGSYDKAGVDRVADRLGAFFASHGLQMHSEGGDTYGRATWTRSAGPGDRTVLMLGHRDTVFPKDETLRRPFAVRDGRAYGPGVSDMKVGLAMQAFILVGMQRFGVLPVPLTMMTTGDEEVSSPWSRPYIEREARTALAVFNAEPGRPRGGVVIARKGSVYLRLEVTGIPAHSGANFFEGASAIGALARKILALESITDKARGITLNVGLVQGGQTVNTVAPQARCQIDLRYVHADDRAELIERIRRIALAEDLPGTRAQLEIYGEMLPMPERPSNLALLEIYKDAAQAAGFEAHGIFTGGCSDAGFTTAVGAPTLCAVGPTGGMVHTPDEFVVLDTLVPRAQALAGAIHAVAMRALVPTA